MLSLIKWLVKGGASALRCGDVKLMFGKIGFKMYQAPQAKIFTDFREGKSVNNLEELFLLFKTLLNQNGSEWYFSIKLSKIELNIVNYDENEIYN